MSGRPGFDSHFRHGSFPRLSLPSNFLMGTLPGAHGVTGSALGLVGPVSVYCDWIRWKV